MRHVAVVFVLALAGCTSPPAESEGPPRAVVEGWVLDPILRAVPGTVVAVVSEPPTAAVDASADGHFRLQVPANETVTLRFAAPGFTALTRTVPLVGFHAWLNVTLERIPARDGRVSVEQWDGLLECAVTFALQEDPDDPHGHEGVSCAGLAPDGPRRDMWSYRIPPNATGLVLEAVWDPSTPFAQSMMLEVVDPGSGIEYGFAEGPSILRVQLAAAALRALGTGASLDVTLLPGAGTGNHDHGAAGVFVQQDFTLYATTFYNRPADPTYSIAG